MVLWGGYMDKKILVVEGHPVFIEKLEGFLKSLTFENILLAPSGKKGVLVAQAENPELIIVSSILPDMDGLEFCQQVRENQPKSHIIVLTGLFENESRSKEFYKLCVDNVLPKKEKNLSILQGVIEECLSLTA